MRRKEFEYKIKNVYNYKKNDIRGFHHFYNEEGTNIFIIKDSLDRIIVKSKVGTVYSGIYCLLKSRTDATYRLHGDNLLEEFYKIIEKDEKERK